MGNKTSIAVLISALPCLTAPAWAQRNPQVKTPSFADEAALAKLAEQSPVWTTPGLDPAGSMIVGNGQLGANVWMEADGDLLLMLSHTDAFSECERLLKLGRIRIACTPPLACGRDFKQQLDLEHGVLRIRAGDADISVLPDSGSSTMFVRLDSATPRTVRVSLEAWRTQDREIKGPELNSSWLMDEAPPGMDVRESADVVVDDPSALVWYHHNSTSAVPLTLKLQGFESVAKELRDPLTGRTFGGRIEGTGFSRADAKTLVSAQPAERTDIRITAACDQQFESWSERLKQSAATNPDFDLAAARTHEWWKKRWLDSFVFVEPGKRPGVLGNHHPLRTGVDSGGGNRFEGSVSRLVFVPRALSSQEIAQASKNASWEHSQNLETKVGANAAATPDIHSAQAFTVLAWVTPAKANSTDRIADKCTAGVNDGMLLDLQHGKLRAIVGDTTVQTNAEPVAGQESVVALTCDANSTVRVFLNGREVSASQSTKSEPLTVSSAWALQRYASAAATRGEFPVKFNGSIFTVAPASVDKRAFNDDFRNWGGDYWWQNTRLPYHGMVDRGDADLMQSLFAFYLRQLPTCEARSRIYYHAAGAYFPETMTTFGTYANRDYGWDRKGKEPGDVACRYWRWAWNQGPELVAMMLDHWDYTSDRDVLERETLPMARAVLTYFDTRFSRDGAGKLVLSPTQAIETYWDGVENDLPTVAGLREITARLCALPATVGSANDRALWEKIRVACPELPMRDDGTGHSMFSVAAKFSPTRTNCENPELMAVWPFRFAGVGIGQLEVGRASYTRRIEKMTHGWTQDGQQAARLGLADESAANLLAKVRNTHHNFRFPTFWGPNFDWLPDQCHGGNLMTTTQEMLVQCAKGKIILCPALPRDWSGVFRLKAEQKTTVTARVHDGVIDVLGVEPASRQADIQPGEGWTLSKKLRLSSAAPRSALPRADALRTSPRWPRP